MHGRRYVWITLLPLSWLACVTFTAGWQKIFSDNPKLGFLAHATALTNAVEAGKIPAAKIAETNAVIFNERLDAAVCAAFLVLVSIVLVDSIRTWFALLSGKSSAESSEAPFIPTRLRIETL